MVDVSVVVPTYGGRATLPRLVEVLGETLSDVDHEIVLVNDASPDDSWPVIEGLADRWPQIVAVDLLHNHGQPVATMCGLAHARGEVVVTMDDDLQHPPDQIPILLAALEAEPDLDAVVGTWPRDQGLLRDLGSRTYAMLDRLAWGTPKGFHHTAFRALRRPVVDALVAHETRSPVIGPTLHRAATHVRNVPVRHDQRHAGQSGFRPLAGVRRALVNFGQGSVAPLHALTIVGVLGAVLAAAITLWVLGVWLLQDGAPPPGWLSGLLVALFFGSLNLLGLGILGQYVQLIVREVRHEPRWSTRRSIGLHRGVTVP